MSESVPEGQPLRFWEIMAFCAFLIGAMTVGVYAWSARSWGVFGILMIVGMAAWMAGTAIGFLFGIPRVRASEDSSGIAQSVSQIVPNTNLEQISDWLTKIIVGATLVQLGPISNSIAAMSVSIGDKLGNNPTPVAGATAAGGVLVLFFSAGLIWGYLWCSLRIFREMQALVTRELNLRALESGPDSPGG